MAVIANRELVDRFSIRRAALHAIRASRERAYLVSPYFMPDVGFISAGARGGPRRGRARARAGGQRQPPGRSGLTCQLCAPARPGIRLFQHHPVAHSKALLVDREFVSLGSYNFDHRSLVYNLELVVNALDRTCNEALAATLLEDMAAGTEIRWEHFPAAPCLSASWNE